MLHLCLNFIYLRRNFLIINTFLYSLMNETELNELVDQLRTVPRENQWIEFKLNNMKPEDVGKRISALSNSACLHKKAQGYLVFGIEDKTKEVLGTKEYLGRQKRGNEEIENWLMQRLDPKIDFRIYDFSRGHLKISLVLIPATVSQPVRFSNTSYIRIGSYTKKLRDYPDKERKIWLSKPLDVFETRIAQSGIEEKDLNSLLSFETYFELLQRPIPTKLEKMVELFIEEKLIVRSPIGYSITNLGAILFSKDLSKFESLRRKSVRLIAYDGKDRTTTKKEYAGNKGYAVAFDPLLRFIDALIPTNEIIKRALRTEVKLYPEISLRELIANAIIHQDFEIGGTGPMVEIFNDRIEISNPGKPIIDPLRFIDHHPRSRNEKLAYFMRRLNFCEERGSGIDKVIMACEAYQLPAPDFIDGTDYTRAILYAPRKWGQMSKTDKIRACYQHCAIRYVSGELMSNSTLRKRFGIEEKYYTRASRIISDTTKAGFIKDSDPSNKSRKHAKYIPFWAS